MSDDPPDGAAPPPGAREPQRGGTIARLHPPGLPHHVTLDRAVQGAIGVQLRKMYEHFVDQPMPDRLADLVGLIASGAPAPVAVSGRGPLVSGASDGNFVSGTPGRGNGGVGSSMPAESPGPADGSDGAAAIPLPVRPRTGDGDGRGEDP